MARKLGLAECRIMDLEAAIAAEKVRADRAESQSIGYRGGAQRYAAAENAAWIMRGERDSAIKHFEEAKELIQKAEDACSTMTRKHEIDRRELQSYRARVATLTDELASARAVEPCICHRIPSRNWHLDDCPMKPSGHGDKGS